MAINKLSTAFSDDIIDSSKNAHRKYKITEVDTDTYTFEDKTEYIQKGDKFGSEVLNKTNSTVNELIDLAETTNDTLESILDGTTSIKNAVNSQTSDYAQTSNKSNLSAFADKLENSVQINGVEFDGSKSITIEDKTKLEKSKDFILINQQTLSFNNLVCEIHDARITANSLADVYFTSDCINRADDAGIEVETFNQYVRLTATIQPQGVLTASIRIRSV